MTQTDLFAKLGAPLANSRWSWGSERRSDGAVFLRVWQDETVKHDGSRYVRVTFFDKFLDDQDNLGYQERLRHIERVNQSAPCYLIMCEAVDVNAMPRQLKSFNDEEVFPGGKIVELNGDWWIELLPRVPVRDVAVKAGRKK